MSDHPHTVSRLRISDIAFTRCRDPRDRTRGLRGWCSVTIDETWRIDGIAVRVNGEGEPMITFPSKNSGGGGDYKYVRALRREDHVAVERAILSHVGEGALAE